MRSSIIFASSLPVRAMAKHYDDDVDPLAYNVVLEITVSIPCRVMEKSWNFILAPMCEPCFLCQVVILNDL